jgi:hypothetical protein
MTESTIPPERSTLAGFARFLASQQTVITDQWLLTVRRDTQIETADRIPTPELVDHLPRLLRELCDFLRTRDVDNLTGGARRDASEHGELRWQDGYKIDELVRELEALRRLAAASVFQYRVIDSAFHGPLEVSATVLIHQFFAEITVASVRQFMQQQQKITRSCVQELADAQQQLGRVSADLAQSRDAQHRTATIVAHGLRDFLRIQPLPLDSTEASSRLAMFARQLLDYAELNVRQDAPGQEPFDPRELFSEVVATYKPIANAKGLQLLAECLTAPAAVLANRARIRKISELLLENAIEYTHSGRISFAFVFSEADRWLVKIRDTGPGLNEQDSAQLHADNPPGTELSPGRGLSLSIVKDLARSVGGSMQTMTQTGVGTQVEVSFPRQSD